MINRRDRRKVSTRKYNLLLVPEGESGKSRSFKVTTTGIILGVFGSVTAIIAFLLVGLIYTPLNRVISIPNPELEKRYLQELIVIQDRLNRVTEDVLYIREYNAQLRRALGQEEEDIEDTIPPTIARAEETARPEAASGLFTHLDVQEDYHQETFFTVPFRLIEGGEITHRPSLPIILPVDGYITRQFDSTRRHFGIDIAGKINTPISAVADGTVVFSNWTYEDGNMMIIAHGSGYFSVYKHNQANLVSQGAVVQRGETIALLGDTGKQSYGPHLHFELWKDGVPVNPFGYMLNLKDAL